MACWPHGNRAVTDLDKDPGRRSGSGLPPRGRGCLPAQVVNCTKLPPTEHGRAGVRLRHGVDCPYPCPFVRSILATDLSQEMIGTARRKADAASVRNVGFEEASIKELDAPAGHFDAILGLSALHLVDDMRRAPGRVHTLLNPGGLFFSSTVCVGDTGLIPTVLVGILSAVRLGPPVNPFSSDELLAAMGRAAFKVVSTWRPAPRKALFVVARKPASRAAASR